VVLFDEIEKAHPTVFNTLLQILDDGRLTDAQGRTVDFGNTVIIMTSNIGSLYLLEGLTGSGEISPDVRDRVMAELRAAFRPSFLNRVDDIVLFKPLTIEEIEHIVRTSRSPTCGSGSPTGASSWSSQSRHARLIARAGYDPVYGARPLRRFIQHEVETRIARALLSGEILDGATITLDADGDELTVTWRNPTTPKGSRRVSGRSGGLGPPWRAPRPSRRDRPADRAREDERPAWLIAPPGLQRRSWQSSQPNSPSCLRSVPDVEWEVSTCVTRSWSRR